MRNQMNNQEPKPLAQRRAEALGRITKRNRQQARSITLGDLTIFGFVCLGCSTIALALVGAAVLFGAI
jgi:hypothetical protein